MFLNLRLYQIKRSVSPQYSMNIGQRIIWCNSCHFDISMLAQLNDCMEAYYIQDRTLLHLVLYYIQDSYYIQDFDKSPFKLYSVYRVSPSCRTLTLAMQYLKCFKNCSWCKKKLLQCVAVAAALVVLEAAIIFIIIYGLAYSDNLEMVFNPDINPSSNSD